MDKMKEEKAKATKTVEEMTKELEISQKKQTEQDTKYRQLQEKNIKNKLNIEQQKQDINKLYQKIRTNEEVIKALRRMQTITVSKATDKEQKIRELWKRIEKEKGMTTIMTKENIEMREKITVMEEKIKVKQKHYEDRGKELENMNIKTQKITKEIEKQKQNWDREKKHKKSKKKN